MHSTRLVWWGYFVEIAATALTLVALCLFFGTSVIIAFVRNAAIDIVTRFCGIVFAAELGFLWTFYSKIDTDFCRWLEKSGLLMFILEVLDTQLP